MKLGRPRGAIRAPAGYNGFADPEIPVEIVADWQRRRVGALRATQRYARASSRIKRRQADRCFASSTRLTFPSRPFT